MVVNQQYRNVNLSTDIRAAALLGEMTIQEKAAQLVGVWVSDLIDADSQFSTDQAQTHIANGAGHISRVGAVSRLPPRQSANLANTIQRFLVENTRLGVPAIIHEESCAGYLAKDATTFPQAIGMAATWEPELIHKMANVIRKQMRSVGAHHTLAPVLDVVRDPRWGRIEETFGEDPFLISAIGNAYINGVQGDDWTEGIVATAKHFLGYGLSEGGLNWAPAHIPEREMREMFVKPFLAAIREANVASVMNAYQELDGVPAGSSRELLQDLLRDELGFNGVIVSDYFTINMFMEYHRIAADKATAARLALEAGIDVELPAADCYGKPLIDALENGAIDIQLVDACVERVLRMKIQLGLLENPFVDTGAVAAVYNTPEQLDLSREIARKSFVLLKNDGDILPLNPSLKSIAVIGPSADSVRLLQGDYHYPSHLQSLTQLADNMEAPNPQNGHRKVAWDEHFPPTTTVLQGIRQRVSPQTDVQYAQGCDVLGEDISGFDTAVKLAQQAEIAIVVVGDKSGLGYGCTTGEAIDRATLDLPGVQQQLIEAVHATGTPTIVVLINGRPPTLAWIDEHIPAVLEAWLPAQEGGKAVADVLFGDVNPGGRLPVSFPRAVGQIPVYYNHKPSGGRSHWYGSYMDISAKPLYPFGHGLSYTQFAYSDLKITPDSVGAGDSVAIQATIKNVGQCAGDEVVQLYVHDVIASVTRPVQELKGFVRLPLNPGEQKTVAFQLDVRHLGYFDRQMQFVAEPGAIEVMIGASSEDIRLRGQFDIAGDITPVDQVFSTPVIISD